MKRSKIIVTFCMCIFCLSFLVIGVYAAITVNFNLQSSLSFNPEGVYVEISGQVYRGEDYYSLEPLTENSSYTLSKTMNYIEENGNPSGNFSISPWTPAEVKFLPSEKFVQYRLNFTNKSDEAISVIPSEITGLPSSIDITEDVSHVLYIESGETASYTLNFELNSNNIMASTTFNTSFNIQKTSELADNQTGVTFTVNNGVIENISGTTSRVFVVPDEINGEKITAIKDGTSETDQAFANLSSDTKYVIMEKGIKTLGSYSFAFNNNLTGIAFPGVTTINESVLSMCTNIKTVNLKNVENVGSESFTNIPLRGTLNLSSALNLDGCFMIAYFNYPIIDNLILNDACELNMAFRGITFKNVDYTTSGNGYTFNNGVLNITDSMGSTLNITADTIQPLILQVEIPDFITSIGYAAFGYAQSLKEITIPSSVQSIGSSAFSNCRFDSVIYEKTGSTYNFKNGHLTLNEGITTLSAEQGEWADDNLTGLVISVSMPSSVTTLDDTSSGGGFSSIKSFTIPNTVTTLDSAFFAFWLNLEELIFEEGTQITIVPELLVGACPNLKTIVFAEGITSIGPAALMPFSLYFNELTLPASITSLDLSLFYMDSGFIFIQNLMPHSLYMLGTAPALTNYASLSELSFYGTLYVKEEYLSTYQTGDWATYFKGTIETF